MSDVSFNLIDRTWIPVTMLHDGSYRLVSILEAFDQAEGIRCIEGDIPLQRFALSRMLLAMMYGIFPEDYAKEEWRELFEAGPGTAEVRHVIHEYCDAYRHRFDLFDDVAPFYQVAGLHTAKNEMSGLERLVLDVPSGEPFFTTRGGEGLDSMSAAEAARWLVTMQAYDASGIKSGAVGDPRVKGGKGYPIGVAWSGHIGGYLVEGKNLWQTLVLNFVSSKVFTAGEDGVRWRDDRPVWERPPADAKAYPGLDQPVADTGRVGSFHGPATLMTWQSRRMLLSHRGETVTGVLVCNGDRLKPQNAHNFETMTAWRRSDSQEKLLKQPLVYMPRKHDPSRALWRGLPTLTVGEKRETKSGVREFLRPRTLDWLSQACPDGIPVRLHVFGVEYGNQEAVVDSTVDDVLDLNLVVLTSEKPEMGQMIRDAVDIVERGIAALRNLASNIAIAENTPGDSQRQRIAEDGYAAFDQAFRRWVRGIDGDRDPRSLIAEWKSIARSLLLRLGERFASQASTRAIVGRDVIVKDAETGKPRTVHYCVAIAEIWYRKKLNVIIPAEKSIPVEGGN